MTIETLNEIKADATALRAGLLDMADKVSLVEAKGVVETKDIVPAVADTITSVDLV